MSDNITHLNPIDGGKGNPPEPLQYTIYYAGHEGFTLTQIITGWLMVAGGLTMVVDDNAQVLFGVRTDNVVSISGIYQKDIDDNTWTFTPEEPLN